MTPINLLSSSSFYLVEERTVFLSDTSCPYCTDKPNPYPANVEYMVNSNNASKWQMGFNSAFKGLIIMKM